MRYLDPKNDLTFKKIFGQHPHLLKSLRQLYYSKNRIGLTIGVLITDGALL